MLCYLVINLPGVLLGIRVALQSHVKEYFQIGATRQVFKRENHLLKRGKRVSDVKTRVLAYLYMIHFFLPKWLIEKAHRFTFSALHA